MLDYRDPTDEILTGFYTLLNGNLSYEGTDWPVKTFGEFGDNFDSTILADVNVTDDSDEDFAQSICTILIEIREGSKKHASWKAVNTISSQVTQLACYNEDNISLTSFEFTTPVIVDSINTLSEMTETHIVVRKLIRLRFSLQQES